MVELDAPEAYEAVTLKAIFNRKYIDSIRVHWIHFSLMLVYQSVPRPRTCGPHGI